MDKDWEKLKADILKVVRSNEPISVATMLDEVRSLDKKRDLLHIQSAMWHLINNHKLNRAEYGKLTIRED